MALPVGPAQLVSAPARGGLDGFAIGDVDGHGDRGAAAGPDGSRPADVVLFLS